MQNSTDSKNASQWDFLLQDCADALARGECTDDEFLSETLGYSDWEADSAWEVLSVIDQRYRTGGLPQSVFESIRARIARRMPPGDRHDAPTTDDWRDAPTTDDWRDAQTSDDWRDAQTTDDWRDAQTIDDRRNAPTTDDRRNAPTTDDRRNAPTVDDWRDSPTVDNWRDAATVELFPPAVAAIAAQLAVTPALSFAPTAASDPKLPVDPRTVHVGRVLRHRYVVESLLGSGGMGDVYKASAGLGALRAESPTPVAVKVLRDRIEQRPDLMQRLQREFDCTRCLSHPNIVKVYEFERNGQFAFYTMELLEGEHLGALLGRAQDRPLPQAYAWSIIGAMGAALVHAHSRNVVHGDMSPKNVMITRDGEVRVLDFGSSSLSQGRGAATTAATADSVAATPAYASCEVLEGQKPDPRDDLYALACLAYELLAGEHPFRGKRSTEARDLNLSPRRPPGVNFLRWRALQRGLAWTRAERSMSVREWLGNLGLEPQPERLPTLRADSEPPAPLHRVPLARGVALGLAVLAGAAVAWYSYTNSPEVISPGAVSPDVAVPTGPPPITAGNAPAPGRVVSEPYIAKSEVAPQAAARPEVLPLAAAKSEAVPLAAGQPETVPLAAARSEAAPPMPAPLEASQPEVAPPQSAPLQVASLQIASPQIGSPQIGSPQVASLQIASPQVASPQIASPQVASPQIASPQIASPQLPSPQVPSPQIASPQIAPPMGAERVAAQPQAQPREAAPPQVAPPMVAERVAAQPQAQPREAAPPQIAPPMGAERVAAQPQAQPREAAPPQVAPPMGAERVAAQPQAQPREAAPPQIAPPMVAERVAAQPQAQPRESAPPQLLPPQFAAPQVSTSAIETPLVEAQEVAPRKSAPRRATATSRAVARWRNARARSMTASAHSVTAKARAMTSRARAKAPNAHSSIQFTDHRYSVPPSARFVETHVRRSRASGDTTKFVWWTDDSTAKAGVDFVAQTPTPYVFSPGRQLASLFVRLVPNPARTQESNFHVCLGKPGSGGSALTDVTCSAILLPANNSDSST